MNLLDEITASKKMFVSSKGRNPDEIWITKKALLDVARLLKMAYYPNEVAGVPVIIWSPTAIELKGNNDSPFRFE